MCFLLGREPDAPSSSEGALLDAGEAGGGGS